MSSDVVGKGSVHRNQGHSNSKEYSLMSATCSLNKIVSFVVRCQIS